MKKSQIFTKTFICTAFIMAFLMLLMHLTIYLIFPFFYLENTKGELTKKADVFSKILTNSDENNIQNYLKFYNKTSDINISITTDKGSQNSIKIDSENNIKIDKANDNNSVFIETRQITLSNNQTATLQFISSRNAKKDAKNLTLNFLPYSILVGLFFSIIFSYFASKIIVKPILLAEKIANDIERAKTTFLRGASHELKTPLAGLRITLENMQYNIGEYKNHKKYLSYSILLVDKMSDTISDILTASSSQEWLDNPSPITVSKELTKIIKEYQPLITQKNLNIKNSLTTEKINISFSAFHKLFSNLISNAVKYSKPNTTINIYNKKHWLYIENIGNPINPKDIPSLFNLFAHQNHKQSTGIGLFIVKNILDYYKIKYKFKPTKLGMIFSIKLPK